MARIRPLKTSGVSPSSMRSVRRSAHKARPVRCPRSRSSGLRALMSTTRSGSATPSASIGISDWPPAIAAVVAPAAGQRRSPRRTVFGRAYSRGRGLHRRRPWPSRSTSRAARARPRRTRSAASVASRWLAPMARRNASATAWPSAAGRQRGAPPSPSPPGAIFGDGAGVSTLLPPGRWRSPARHGACSRRRLSRAGWPCSS